MYVMMKRALVSACCDVSIGRDICETGQMRTKGGNKKKIVHCRII